MTEQRADEGQLASTSPPDGDQRDNRDDGATGQRAPEHPTDLTGPAWSAAVKRTVREFRVDNLTDWAAALTYYGVLSIFPAMLVLVSLIGLAGQDATETLIQNVEEVAPEAVRQVLVTGIQQLQQSQRTAGALAIVGLAVAFWSASSYIAAFMRASNAIYDVPEGRPLWKTLPIRIGVTVLITTLLAISALAVVITGGLADRIGRVLGIGSAAVTAWDIAKWPVLLIIVSFMFALLYWASPNARQGFRWLTPGGILAVVVWLIASGAFAVYVANFGSYNKTYGSLAGVIIFLVWLWISNIAVLLGAELNAELQRGRAIAGGHPDEKEPYLELRDTRKIRKRDAL
jgi:membrane protein